MFASHNRLFTLWTGMQMLLTVLSGVPRLECACREAVVGFLPGSEGIRASSCCCGHSTFLGNLGTRSCQSSCHRKLVPPDAATRIIPQPVNANADNLWMAVMAPTIPAHWLAEETWGRTGPWPELVGRPTGCLHHVLRI
ncbi:MAG: hypothetical protein FD138_3723 [Planctomycetota bacterium]|nr:MAG: hypothetical protein FD138_3723 [Planctomycetota bacterium]